MTKRRTLEEYRQLASVWDLAIYGVCTTVALSTLRCIDDAVSKCAAGRSNDDV